MIANWFTKKRIVLLAISVALVLICIVIGFMIYNNRKTMPLSHVYVCDNPEEDSEFDKWIRNEAMVDWVPTYVIIKNGYVIGTIKGGISQKQFSSRLATVLIQGTPYAELPDIEISNLKDEKHSLKSIMTGDDVYILEISWIDCKDCKFQDDNYTDEIYLRYSTKMIYRYYIRSDKDKVLDKYN